MRSASVSGIVTGAALVRYWPIFSPSLVKVPKVFAKINSAQFSSLVSRTQLFWSSVKFSHQRYVSIIRFIRQVNHPSCSTANQKARNVLYPSTWWLVLLRIKRPLFYRKRDIYSVFVIMVIMIFTSLKIKLQILVTDSCELYIMKIN